MTAADRNTTWRTTDIVVTAAIAVTFGVVFWAWNGVWAAAAPVFTAVPPAQNVLYGVWLIPAVLAMLVVRKPGAALFAELVAAGVSALLGSQWGLDAVLSGILQGLGAEAVFAAFRYRRFDLPVALLAGLGAAAGAFAHDIPLYYADQPVTTKAAIGICMAVSAVVIAGIGSWWLCRSLAATGVLAPFASGRGQARV